MTNTPTSFLQKYQPDGMWPITAIKPDGGIAYATFGPRDLHRLKMFISKRMPTENLYYNVGQVRSDLGNNRAAKADIVSVSHLHVDVDPPEGVDPDEWREDALGQLTSPPKGVPKPTVIVSSGNGYQALWKLTEPTTDIARAEDANIWLCDIFGGDTGTHDVSRLLRLPGTKNLPDTKKRAKGRVERETALLHLTDASYRLESFGKGGSRIDKPATLGDAPMPDLPTVREAVKTDDLATLQAAHLDVPARAWLIVNHGRHPDEPPKEGDDTRSAWLFDAVCQLLRGGVSGEVILGLLLDPGFGIAESVLELGRNAERYARKQIRSGQKIVQADEAMQFTLNDEGKPHNTLHNWRVALHKLGVKLTKDTFNERYIVEGLAGFGPRLDDPAVVRLRHTIRERFGFKIAKDEFYDFLQDEAEKARFHPVADYLDRLHWDGVHRLGRWLIDFCGVADSPYARAVGRLFLVAAVRRIRSPGAKFDEMVVLEGAQGGGKSTLLRTLAVNPDWFSDDLPLGADGKRVIEATAGKWIVEAAEMVGQSNKNVEHLKSMLSRTFDEGRMAYGRMTLHKDREFVVVGTTNGDKYLKDPTGNRRYWPVLCGVINLDGIAQLRDQLWAEACEAEAAGEAIRLDLGLWGAAASEQASR